MIAATAVIVGAVGSVALMLRVGQRNESRLLLLLFTCWVVSPFVALTVAGARSLRWSRLTRTALHGLMGVIPAGSLVLYGGVAFGPPRPTPAFLFLAVPLASWLLIVTVLPIAAWIAGRRSERNLDQ